MSCMLKNFRSRVSAQVEQLCLLAKLWVLNVFFGALQFICGLGAWHMILVNDITIMIEECYNGTR